MTRTHVTRPPSYTDSVAIALSAMAMLLLGAVGTPLTAQDRTGEDAPGDLTDPREVRLANVRQLTFEGENAEAYFKFDGSKLVFQPRSTPWISTAPTWSR